MDYYNQYNMKSMNDPQKSNHLTNITRVLLSVSVFAFLLSQSSLVPLLVTSYDNLVLDFSNFKFELFTYTTERNCIFLLCNGILLLIIQSSGLISNITPVISPSKAARIEDHHEEREDETGKFQENGEKGVGKDEILEEKTGEVAAEFVEMEEDDDDDGGGGRSSYEIDERKEKEDDDEEEDDDDDGQSLCEIEERKEDDEEEEDGDLGVDELNKKCEDFIKKMKKLIQGS